MIPYHMLLLMPYDATWEVVGTGVVATPSSASASRFRRLLRP